MAMLFNRSRPIPEIAEKDASTENIVITPSSWSEYITTVLTDSGFVSRGAIYGKDGRRWAASKGFDVRGDEIRTLVCGFTDPIRLWRHGVRIGGRTYTCTRSESGLIMGRESAEGSGCVIYKCNRCLVIAVHDEGAHPGGCYNLVLKLGEYLKDQGI